MPMSAWPFAELRPMSYDVIVADPPWDFEAYSRNGHRKHALPHYRLMDLDAIKALPVARLARGDALLFLWSTGAMLPMQIDTLRAWGFTYKSQLVWRKTTINGRVRFGTGYRARSCHENILIGAIGKPAGGGFPSIFDGLAREHSRKPDEFYTLVEKHAPATRRADLFARQSRPGWDVWGDQVSKFDVEAAA